jgi:hypothetical protein
MHGSFAYDVVSDPRCTDFIINQSRSRSFKPRSIIFLNFLLPVTFQLPITLTARYRVHYNAGKTLLRGRKT